MSINNATPSQWDALRRKDREWRDNQAWVQSAERKETLARRYNTMAIEESAEIAEGALPTDAKARKGIPIYTGFIAYFPRAIAAVAKLSLVGGIQHGQTAETLHWNRDLSGDELDAMMRHIIDGDWEQVAWRAMANLEKKLEKVDGGVSN
jgi:hypothetical protein